MIGEVGIRTNGTIPMDGELLGEEREGGSLEDKSDSGIFLLVTLESNSTAGQRGQVRIHVQRRFYL